ncbi:MAG TPA: hypothetical protein V6D08_11210 [Candidatus Obscuribacterales bacterium]
MHRAISAVIALALCLGMSASVGVASDWAEDESGARQQTIPRPAPPFQKRNWQDETEDKAPERAAFYVSPPPAGNSGGKPKLEANISKWGAAGSADSNRLDASVQDGYSSPDRRGGPLNGLVDSLFNQDQPFVMPKARSVPPTVFRGFIERTHPRFALSTGTLARDRLVEVKGAWDDSSRTLRSLGIPHTRIRAGKLREWPLDGVDVLVVNCAGDVPREAWQRVRDFVSRGGFLLTTDWALDGLVKRAFPGYIDWNGGKTGGKVVDAVVIDPDPVLTKGVARRAGWKLDEGSQTVRIMNPGKVQVLVRSRQLATNGDDPDRLGILACAFKFGRGQVLHLVGHFDNNSGLAFVNALPDPAPGIGISIRQAIATNFVVAGLSGSSAR